MQENFCSNHDIINYCRNVFKIFVFIRHDSVIVDAMASVGLNSFMILVMMVVIWLILGMLLDSISIILLTVPLFVLLAGDMNLTHLQFLEF